MLELTRSVPPLSSTVQANPPAEYAYHPIAVRLRQELRTANIIQTKKAKILDEILLMTLAGLADPTISAEVSVSVTCLCLESS